MQFSKRLLNPMLWYRFFLRKSLWAINLILLRITLIYASLNPSQSTHPLVFIIGAPRSGSTLLSQLITNTYKIGFLSNLHATFYGAVPFIEQLFRVSDKNYAQDYTSYYGKTSSWYSPSESGEFWYQFFRRRPQYVPLSEANPTKMTQLTRILQAMLGSFKKAILFKNLNCTLRLIPTYKAAPQSLFIVIKRNKLDNAHSIMTGRKKLHGSYDHWMGQEPPNIAELKQLQNEEQVIGQIDALYHLIEEAKTEIPKNRFIELHYDDLCSNPKGIISALDAFFKEHSVRLDKRHVEIPEQFTQSKAVKLDGKMYKRLAELCKD